MKKIVGYLIAGMILAGMLLLLYSNKRKMQRQISDAGLTDQSELVSTLTVREENYSLRFNANGTTQAARELNFVSDIAGRVVQVYVDKGKHVAKGTPLLKIDTELYEADYKAAKSAYDALKVDEERVARSFEAGGVSKQQMDNIRAQLVAAESRLKASRWKYENSVIKSPIAGTINNRYVEVGSLLSPNAPLFDIVDESVLKLLCNVPESRVRLISKGMRVRAVDSRQGNEFTGTVSYIGIKADRGLNYPVEVVMDPDNGLHVGMYLKVDFSGTAERSGILVPRKCIVGSARAANLYVAIDGRAHRREVKLGEMVGDKIEVLNGISAGDQVIDSGLMNLGDGTPVRVINK